MSLRITYKLLMMLVIAMVTALSGKAQTTVEVGLADLRFCNIAVNGGKITMDLQIRSAITAEQFAIGAGEVRDTLVLRSGERRHGNARKYPTKAAQWLQQLG